MSVRDVLALLLLACLFAVPAAQAHKASTSYLRLEVDGAALAGRWDIGLRDLDYAIGLDASGDGELTWGEVQQAQARIGAYALSRLAVSADGRPCELHLNGLRIVEHGDGNYAVLDLSGSCPHAPLSLALRYSLLFELDTLHRGLLDLRFQGVDEGERSGLFSPQQPELRFARAHGDPLTVFTQYFRAGLWHVWSGLDHMLFLAGLFLPAVLRRHHGAWLPAPRLGVAVRDTTVMVTAFTLAHACTLSLAATGAFTLPSRLVECGVAATVLFAGLNNLVPMVYRELYWLAGAFGLIHGAAIATALIELGLPPGSRVWALLAFNLGVEAAQLSVLLAVIPPSFVCRHSVWYRRLVLIPGSLLVTLAGLSWLIERGLAVDLGIPLP
ncbi:MAG TPA: HupE/UreJ family protein [Nevskia sp.]|nr:HupE/UreJ family protein [Nevskia sp.]